MSIPTIVGQNALDIRPGSLRPGVIPASVTRNPSSNPTDSVPAGRSNWQDSDGFRAGMTPAGRSNWQDSCRSGLGIRLPGAVTGQDNWQESGGMVPRECRQRTDNWQESCPLSGCGASEWQDSGAGWCPFRGRNGRISGAEWQDLSVRWWRLVLAKRPYTPFLVPDSMVQKGLYTAFQVLNWSDSGSESCQITPENGRNPAKSHRKTVGFRVGILPE